MQAVMVEPLRKHPGKEERVIANVFAHLALTVERRRGAVNRIGLQQHLAHVTERTPVSISDLVESFGFAEFGEQVGYIVMHFRAAHANFIVIAFNHFLEKPLKRIRFRYHLATPFPCTTPLMPLRRHRPGTSFSKLGNADSYECSMGSLGYLKQVISEVPMHFGSSTNRLLKADGQ